MRLSRYFIFLVCFFCLRAIAQDTAVIVKKSGNTTAVIKISEEETEKKTEAKKVEKSEKDETKTTKAVKPVVELPWNSKFNVSMVNSELEAPLGFQFSFIPKNNCTISPENFSRSYILQYTINCDDGTSHVDIHFPTDGSFFVRDIHTGHIVDSLTVAVPKTFSKNTPILACTDKIDPNTCTIVRILTESYMDEVPKLTNIIPNFYAKDLSPPFHPDTHFYTLHAYTRSRISITAVANSDFFVDRDIPNLSNNCIDHEHEYDFVVPEVNNTESTITFYVTNSKHSVYNNYTVNVVSTLSLEPRLFDVHVSQTPLFEVTKTHLEPAFESHRYTYYVFTNNKTQSVHFNFETVNLEQTEIIHDKEVLGVGTGQLDVPLVAPYVPHVRIVTRNKDTHREYTYVFIIVREDHGGTKLKELNPTLSELNTGFEPDGYGSVGLFFINYIHVTHTYCPI